MLFRSSKLTKGELQLLKSLDFKPSPLKRSGYIISAAHPWSTITLFTSYPPILRVTTRVSSCGCMVPYFSASEKLNTRGTFVLILFDTELGSSSKYWDIDIILEWQDPVLLGAANMTFMVPRGGYDAAFP